MASGPPKPAPNPEPGFSDPLVARLAAWVANANALATEGLPMPVQQVKELVDGLLARGETEKAERTIARSEQLIERVQKDWALVREQLRRTEELKELATKCGLDLSDFDDKVGNPRAILRGGRLSEALLEQTSASASRCLAVLNDALPKYLAKEGQSLGTTVRTARERGEDVGDAAERLDDFIASLKAGQLRGAGQAFLALRRAVAQIRPAPTVAVAPQDEEEEILQEARNLARRLQRMKGRAHDASSAARLMSQVKAALSEDRRYASPEEEIEELWSEVDRLSRERTEARATPTAATTADDRGDAELDPSEIPPEFLEAANGPLGSAGGRSARRGSKGPRNSDQAPAS